MSQKLQDVAQQIAPVVTQIGSITSTGSGMWLWLGQNNKQIAACGVLIGIIFGLVGVYFQFKAYRLHKRKTEALLKFKEREDGKGRSD